MMHMGALPMIGHYQPKKFIHIVLDNEAYETTGNQNTISAKVDFEGIAKSSGYRSTYSVSDPEKLKTILPKLLNESGPVLIRVKINRIETKGIPRITTKYAAPQITEAFKQGVDQDSLVGHKHGSKS